MRSGGDAAHDRPRVSRRGRVARRRRRRAAPRARPAPARPATSPAACSVWSPPSDPVLLLDQIDAQVASGPSRCARAGPSAGDRPAARDEAAGRCRRRRWAVPARAARCPACRRRRRRIDRPLLAERASLVERWRVAPRAATSAGRGRPPAPPPTPAGLERRSPRAERAGIAIDRELVRLDGPRIRGRVRADRQRRAPPRGPAARSRPRARPRSASRHRPQGQQLLRRRRYPSGARAWRPRPTSARSPTIR